MCKNQGDVSADRWFRAVTQRYQNPRVRLVCFPHAGGTASYFRGWGRLVPYGVEVLAVRYPGREDRLLEPLAQSMEELADGVLQAVPGLFDVPVAFFGHSMGASVAYEVALRLRAGAGPSPTALFLSGRSGPGHDRTRGLAAAGDAELIDDVVAMGGTDAQAFADPELRELVLPVIRADYALVERYRARIPDPELDVPVVAYHGDADPALDDDSVAAWQAVTRGPFDVRRFTGGHFYLADHARDLVEDVVARLESAPKEQAARPI
ncbi:thioesterase [Streptomyces cinnamoneus]|uniref:Thioesterase n=1 Tax=Streptomyces cinnamoneus TaxID=53446 RepID=A0A2G1XLW5_STRCJ|nr:thioesterase [Streptomyces cinnamoneus]PPT12133.1 thioesterase [Streptomyces cinnamoneus]